jgi:hypothetical protein
MPMGIVVPNQLAEASSSGVIRLRIFESQHLLINSMIV